MRVVDRRRVLPEVTIGLNKEGQAIILTSILSKSELEKISAAICYLRLT